MNADQIYISSHNGQMACAEHRPLYGRIPWRRMTPAEVAAMKADVADILPASESLCEICNRPYRMAKIAAGSAEAGVGR